MPTTASSPTNNPQGSSSPMVSCLKKKKTKKKTAEKQRRRKRPTAKKERSCSSSISSIGTKSTAKASESTSEGFDNSSTSNSCRSIDLSSIKTSISSLQSPQMSQYSSVKSSFSSIQSPPRFGSIKSSLSSLTTSINSPQPIQQGDGAIMTPLNDMGSPVRHHKRGSNSSLISASSRTSCSSIGESSLSSFLSVLLEDEEAEPSEISIVSDNPKPEQRSIREMRLSFIRSAYNNDKPKCRWDYLTRDNNDREQLARSRRRSKLEHRSLSFTDSLDGAKGTLRLPSRNSAGSLKDSSDVYSALKKKKAKEGMFLRMPVRKGSPTSAASKKKSLMSRVNMSDTDLILLPIKPGTNKVAPPKKPKRKSSSHSRSNRRSRSPDSKGNNRAEEETTSNNGNATWSNADTTREQRRRNSNQFLDIILQPEQDSGSSWPSPLPSPAIASRRCASLGIKQRQLGDLSASLFLLGDDSGEEDEVEETNLLAKTRPKKTSTPKKSLSLSSSSSKQSRSSDSKQSRSSDSSHSRISRISYVPKPSSNSSFASSKQSRSTDSNHSRRSSGSYVPKPSSSSSNQSRRSNGSSSTKSSARKHKAGSNSSIMSYYKGHAAPDPSTLKVIHRKSITDDSPVSLKAQKTPEKCSAMPPQLPTRFHNQLSPPFVSSPTKSPEGKKKKTFLVPLSPKKSKASVAPTKQKSCLKTTSSYDSPRSTKSKKSISKKSTTTLATKSPKTGRRNSPQKHPPQTDTCPKHRGLWYSPFDKN